MSYFSISEIFIDAGQIPMHFIRFNPDRYQAEQLYKSPWKNGTIIDQEQWDSRLQALKQYVTSCIHQIPIKEILVKNMFYDHLNCLN